MMYTRIDYVSGPSHGNIGRSSASGRSGSRFNQNAGGRIASVGLRFRVQGFGVQGFRGLGFRGLGFWGFGQDSYFRNPHPFSPHVWSPLTILRLENLSSWIGSGFRVCGARRIRPWSWQVSISFGVMSYLKPLLSCAVSCEHPQALELLTLLRDSLEKQSEAPAGI